MVGKFVDLLITDRDITLDVAGMPGYVEDRASIAQDIKHMIIESGILVELIAERSPMKWASNMTRLERMVENDIRIIPGSIILERDTKNIGKIFMTANTVLGRIGYSLRSNDMEYHHAH